MTMTLILARIVVSVLVVVFVGLAFLPHFAAEQLVVFQNFLTDKIERREADRRRSDRGR